MLETAIARMLGARERIIRNSIDLINIPSLSSDNNANMECLDYLAAIAKGEGLRSVFTNKRDCLVIEIGEGSEIIGILTHVDVVDVGDIEKWVTHPFEGVYDGANIIGRGAMDDKVPVSIIFNILCELNKMDLALKRKLRLIVGTKEEEQWTDMESYLEQFEPPAFSFTPDGAFPIHNIEKGYADVIITFLLEPEFEGGRILELECGGSPNTIPSKGRACIEKDGKRIVLTSYGRSTHSSLPQNGKNALTELAGQIIKQHLNNEPLNRFMTFVAAMDYDYYGHFLGFDNDVDHYHGEYIGKSCANPTMLKLTGEKLSLNINIRHKLGVSKNDIAKIFRRCGEKYGFDFEISDYLEPLYVNRYHPYFEKMNEAYEKVTRLEGGFALAGGTTYAKALPQSVCWGPVFPGEKDTCHQENEKISMESVMKCIEIYGRFLYAVGLKERISV